MNERNAGRKKVKDGKRIVLTVNRNKEKQVKEFVKSITIYEEK